MLSWSTPLLPLLKGRYQARLARDQADIARAQALRFRSFLQRRGLAQGAGLDADDFDDLCGHVLLEERDSGRLVGCYRLLPIVAGASLRHSYAGQAYDLSALDAYDGAKLELGRFCLDPDCHDPDILRLAWAAMTRIVDAGGVKLLFGCSSFDGADPSRHQAALALLRNHLSPAQWAPRPRAAEIHRYSEASALQTLPREAITGLPTLLRTYLAMGGWVSDHAVIDRDLDTLHVFTAVEIDRIPPARARALRAVAMQAD